MNSIFQGDINTDYTTGMPVRPEIITTKNDKRVNVSVIDNLVDTHTKRMYDENEQTNGLSGDSTIGMSLITDSPLKNISMVTTEHLNAMSISIYNKILENTIGKFVLCTPCIISMFIDGDNTLTSILRELSNKFMYHDKKISDYAMNTRSSAKIDTNTKDFMVYEDNNLKMIECIFNTKFALGFFINKSNNEFHLNEKIFYGYVSNLVKSHTNIKCIPFVISNKINMSSSLRSLGYISNNYRYIHTNYFELCKTQFISDVMTKNTTVIKNNYTFYVRHIPNNVILYIGNH